MVILMDMWFSNDRVNGCMYPHCMSLRRSGTSDCLGGRAKEGVADAVL